MSDSDRTSDGPCDEIVHRELDRDQTSPAVAVAEVVAELEGTEPAELPSTYNCIDHVIDHIFSEPPAPEAQVAVEFSYQGYRITVEQDGSAEFVKTE